MKKIIFEHAFKCQLSQNSWFLLYFWPWKLFKVKIRQTLWGMPSLYKAASESMFIWDLWFLKLNKREQTVREKGNVRKQHSHDPQALHQWYASLSHFRILIINLVLSFSFFSHLFISFSIPFLHQCCRYRAVLMPLAVLINCDSGPRNKSLHLNIEQPTVQYLLYLVLMSLSTVHLYSFLICFFFFFFNLLLLLI